MDHILLPQVFVYVNLQELERYALRLQVVLMYLPVTCVHEQKEKDFDALCSLQLYIKCLKSNMVCFLGLTRETMNFSESRTLLENTGFKFSVVQIKGKFQLTPKICFLS